MPTVASFLGVTITLYPNDHQPPHFHAFHGGDEAMIGIHDIGVLAGRLPSARLKEVLAWAHRHQAELLACWQHCQNRQPVPKVAYP